MQSRVQPQNVDQRRIKDAIASAVRWLQQTQQSDGHWVGRLQTNSSMEAEWILAFHVLGITDNSKRDGLVQAILNEQRADGSWEVFHGAPTGEASITVECYAALRCAGIPANDPALTKARQWIWSNNALRQVRVFTKIWLALLGEWPWTATPQLPPELIFFPAPWFPFNIYQFSCWARATLVPLAIVSALRPIFPLPPEQTLQELFPSGRESFDYRLPRKARVFSWETIFLAADRALRWYAGCSFKPFRSSAIARSLEWIIRHQDADGAWGGIQPPWIYSLIALKLCGYSLEHPVLVAGIKALASRWACPVGHATYIQASNSPVWDTVLTLVALLDSGYVQVRTSFNRALEWLLREEVQVRGDWAVMAENVEPSGWAFEYANDNYPDIDDTAVVLQVLARLCRTEAFEAREALVPVINRAVQWITALQCRNGGWASFDKDNDRTLITKIPFCDFGEVLDPASVDVTAHVLEALGYLGRTASDPVVKHALAFVLSEQEHDGSWFGRWGVNYLYGTGAVLPALRAIGYPMDDHPVRIAGEWLIAHQNDDGGWGESACSYMDDSLAGKGASTVSQSAWALMGLLAIGDRDHAGSIRRGVEFLLQEQDATGTWDELQYTGTGFPGYGLGRRGRLGTKITALPQGNELSRGFMLNYHMYRHYFPLMALARASKFLELS